MACLVDYPPDSQFPIENLPYGVFSTNDNPKKRIGVAIGELILDLKDIAHLFTGSELLNHQNVFKEETLNSLMGLERPAWVEARATIQGLLRGSLDKRLKHDQELQAKAIVSQSSARMHLPVYIQDYTDFFSSLHHAHNCSTGFKSPNDYMSIWRQLPMAYHGRASSVVISGTNIHRPRGQLIENGLPAFGICKRMDFELEMGVFIGGKANQLGDRVPIERAQERIFGMVLMNDWSARDIQKREWVPLGPFTGKNFGTSISPWVVTMEALEPFKVPNLKQEPRALDYLYHDDPYNFNITVQADIVTLKSKVPTRVCLSNYNNVYWTIKQQVTQQTVTGCNLNPGDLLGSGTLSGKDPKSLACLLEIAIVEGEPLKLNDGSTRVFLEDGDEVILSGWCYGDGYRVGFGECRGCILPVKN